MSTLVCRIELNKENKTGITLTVENKDANITQTAVLNGESITLTSKGPEDTSTITQKPDSIYIKCKDFTLETETITCTSTKDTLHKSDQKFDIKSAKDMTLKTQAKLTQQATGDATLSSNKKISIAALSNAELSGANTTVSAKSKAEVKGITLALSGSAKAEMKGGATAEVSSQGMLDLKSSGMTTVKGSMTNIQGTLVKLG